MSSDVSAHFPAPEDADRTPVSEPRGRRHRPADPRVTVVVPAKNEAANILEILPFLEGFAETIVVIAKSDRESAAAARIALPSAKVIYQTRGGKGNALACGFHEATGDIIVTFDIDGSADPHEIPRFVRALTDGADLAKGSRFCAGGGSRDITLFRRLGNFGLNMAASVLTTAQFTDLCYGFNAFWADQLPVLDLPDPRRKGPMVRGDGFEIEAMIIGRFALAGAVISEVPSYEHHRYHGGSNLNAVKDGMRVLRTLLEDRIVSSSPPRVGERNGGSAPSAPRRPSWMDNQPSFGIRPSCLQPYRTEAVAGAEPGADREPNWPQTAGRPSATSPEPRVRITSA